MQRWLTAPAAVVVVMAASLAPAASGADPPLATVFAAPIPTVEADLNITVILAGFALSGAERTALLDGVQPFWWPTITGAKLPIGVNYTINAQIVDAPSAFMDAYAQFLNASFANDTLARALGNYVGVFENVSAAFPAWSEDTPVRHASAPAAADWLVDSDSSFPSLAPSPGAARLVFLNPEAIAEPYYYTAASVEFDRGNATAYETANAWGDDGGLFFQDLRALPGHLGEFGGQGRPVSFAGTPPYWSYGTNTSERARLVDDLARYVDTAVEQLIAPSFGLAPFIARSFTVNITVLDATASGTALSPGGVGAAFGIDDIGDILNTSLIETSLRDLVPYSTILARRLVHTNATDPELAGWAQASSALQGGELVFDPFHLESLLRARWKVPGLPIEPGEDVSVPTLLIITDGPSWVDKRDVRGVTLQRSDGRSGGIIIACGLGQLAERAFSETVVHESGHALGFGHPHEVSFLGENGTVVTLVDWLHTQSSTPMTYLPAYVDYSFDSFDRHSLWIGVAAVTLGEAYQLRQAAYGRLDSLGYNRSTVPSAIALHETLFSSYANTTLSLLQRGILYIEAEPPYSAGGAIMMAKHAYDEAKEITTRAALSPRCCAARVPTFLPGPDLAAAAGAFVVAGLAVAAWGRKRPD